MAEDTRTTGHRADESDKKRHPTKAGDKAKTPVKTVKKEEATRQNDAAGVAAKKVPGQKTAAPAGTTSQQGVMTPANKKEPISPFERIRMITEAAYYRAEKRGFLAGNPAQDWTEAEREIDSRYTVYFDRSLFGLGVSEGLEAFYKSLESHSLSAVDLNGFLEAQRKNVQALSEAHRKALEGTRELLSQQTQTLAQALDEAVAAIAEFSRSKPASGDEDSEQQQRFLEVLQKPLVTAQELSETAIKANAAAIEPIRRRIAESIEELKRLVSGQQK